MRKKKVAWGPQDVFLVPQRDGLCTIGQVLEVPMPNIASVVLYELRAKCEPTKEHFRLDSDFAISLLWVSSEQLDFGAWMIITKQPIEIPQSNWSNEDCRQHNWVGARVFDAAIAEDFLNAFYGLTFWDDWKDPQYLDKLLANPDRKPAHLLFKNRPN